MLMNDEIYIIFTFSNYLYFTIQHHCRSLLSARATLYILSPNNLLRLSPHKKEDYITAIPNRSSTLHKTWYRSFVRYMQTKNSNAILYIQ